METNHQTAMCHARKICLVIMLPMLGACGKLQDTPAAASPASAPAVAAGPLKYKGFKLGGACAEAQMALGSQVRCDGGDGYGEMRGVTTFAGEVVETTHLLSLDGRLEGVAIHIKPEAFNGVVAALEANYGPPQQHAETTAANAMGAQFARQTVTWVLADGSSIEAVNYVTATAALVTLGSKKANAYFEARAKARVEAAKKDV